MGTTVEQRRRISRYAILVLFMFLVAGSLSTENHWPVFAAITGPSSTPAADGQVASAAFDLHDVDPGERRDSAQMLREIARDSLAAAGIGGGNRPADQDRPPEVEPLEFASAAGNPPVDPPTPSSSNPRPDVSAAGGGCGGGRGSGFIPPGCLVREVARTMGGMSKEDRQAAAHSLGGIAWDQVQKNRATLPDHLASVGAAGRPDRPETASRPDRPDRPTTASRPERPERPEIAGRPERPERPEKPDHPGRGRP